MNNKALIPLHDLHGLHGKPLSRKSRLSCQKEEITKQTHFPHFSIKKEDLQNKAIFIPRCSSVPLCGKKTKQTHFVPSRLCRVAPPSRLSRQKCRLCLPKQTHFGKDSQPDQSTIYNLQFPIYNFETNPFFNTRLPIYRT